MANALTAFASDGEEDENTVSDNILGETFASITIAPSTGSLPPEVSVTSPISGFSTTTSSTIRLQANSFDPDGSLDGVRFYINGEALDPSSWNGYLDFSTFDPLNVDGQLLSLDDGILGHSPVTIEFDTDGSTLGSSAPNPVPSIQNQLNDLTLTGSYTAPYTSQFIVEIDGVGTIDTYRWSKDGGQSYVEEKRPISTFTDLPLSDGLNLFFVKPNGHGLGDRWSFTARPANLVVHIPEQLLSSTDSARLYARDALQGVIEQQRDYDLLSFRTSTEGSTDKLYLQHDMDRMLTSSPVVSGDILGISGNLILNYDPLFLVSREHAYGDMQHPFGATWSPSAAGDYFVYAIAFDKDGGNQVVSRPVMFSVTTGSGIAPMVELNELEDEMVYSGTAQNISLSAFATDADGVIRQVSFYVNGELAGTDTSSPYEAAYDINASGIYEIYAVASDDDGNDITSAVQRIKVVESADAVVPLRLPVAPPIWVEPVKYQHSTNRLMEPTLLIFRHSSM